ncbi:MAG: class I SAM-dependent methyltransferase [Lachnospiraceae bacterium]|nr:class I SAM-dependent methyltransferase [Lachnospiraceae bacterium]
MQDSRKQWIAMHQNNRYRPRYPSETVVQFVFRNFVRDGKTKVLDLGCGAGRHVFFLGNENIIPYGLDYSDEGIRYTKEVLVAQGMEQFVSNMQVGTLTDLPYEDDYFDGIICYGSLYYLDWKSIEKAASEMYRVLKTGGKLFLVVRTTEDYRYKLECALNDEPHTIIVHEEDDNKCAHSENGMLMHFFDEQELKVLYSKFTHMEIDYIKETHGNQQFCDCNYLLTAEK